MSWCHSFYFWVKKRKKFTHRFRFTLKDSVTDSDAVRAWRLTHTKSEEEGSIMVRGFKGLRFTHTGMGLGRKCKYIDLWIIIYRFHGTRVTRWCVCVCVLQVYDEAQLCVCRREPQHNVRVGQPGGRGQPERGRSWWPRWGWDSERLGLMYCMTHTWWSSVCWTTNTGSFGEHSMFSFKKCIIIHMYERQTLEGLNS